MTRDAQGKVFTVRYDAVNAMLLNEFLKEHHQVQDLKAIVVEQQKQIEALTSGLEKVTAQLEASKPAPKMALNLQAIAAQYEKKLNAVTARLNEQAAQIQKVSAQLEVNRPARQIVGSNQ